MVAPSKNKLGAENKETPEWKEEEKSPPLWPSNAWSKVSVA